jgi:hypothetical protein
MARELGLAVLQPDYRGSRIPVMEHFIATSRPAVRHFTGLDPLGPNGPGLNAIYKSLAERYEIDLFWGEGPVADDRETHDWNDGESVKTTRQGHPAVQWGIFHVVSQEDGRHFLHVPKPTSLEEALQFDPLHYFPETEDDYHERFVSEHARLQNLAGETGYVIPHHYTTAFHWPLAIFGFELLCEAGMEEDDFAELMKRFAEISCRITRAWARVEGVEAFICHDDLTMTSGPIFKPDWYRKHIFPHYPRIFAPLKERGIPLIFTSDGNCSCFVDDIFAAGADGLNVEYLVNLAHLVERYGDKILIGNINSATIARGPVEKIEHEVRQCLEIGSRAPRFVANVGGGLTHDMPVKHLEAYLAIRSRLCREIRAG